MDERLGRGVGKALKVVVLQIGNSDKQMTHSMGDFNYFLRARKAGFSIWTMPGIIGRCEPNVGHLDHAFSKGSIREAWRYFISTKCLSVRPWAKLHRRHGDVLWPAKFISPCIRFWLAAILDRLGI